MVPMIYPVLKDLAPGSLAFAYGELNQAIEKLITYHKMSLSEKFSERFSSLLYPSSHDSVGYYPELKIEQLHDIEHGYIVDVKFTSIDRDCIVFSVLYENGEKSDELSRSVDPWKYVAVPKLTKDRKYIGTITLYDESSYKDKYREYLGNTFNLLQLPQLSKFLTGKDVLLDESHPL
jgi:hypothetical protein